MVLTEDSSPNSGFWSWRCRGGRAGGKAGALVFTLRWWNVVGYCGGTGGRGAGEGGAGGGAGGGGGGGAGGIPRLPNPLRKQENIGFKRPTI